jgi:hypothetical protein
MFENAYHQAAQDGASYQSVAILPNARKRVAAKQEDTQPCGKYCFDKPCERSNCPLGE